MSGTMEQHTGQEEEAAECAEKHAYLRFHHNNHCILTFKFELEDKVVGKLCEDVQTVRQDNETVDALLVHTEKKLRKLIKDKSENSDYAEQLDLKLSLRNKNKVVNQNNLLRTLQTIKALYFWVLNVRYNVLINAPSIDKVKLPDVIYCGNKIQPDVFKTSLIKLDLCQYWWFRSKDKKEWVEVGNKFKYSVSEDDIGYYLKFKCLPRNQNIAGPQTEIESDRVVLRMPEILRCPFEDRHEYTKNYLNGNQIRVVTYNTLSCRYTGDQYEYCPLEYISIDYRKKLIAKEILGYKADIICLQEVDLKVFSTYLNSVFKEAGYSGIYNKKGNRMPEGLALFYNKNRFSRIKNDQIVINMEVKRNTKMRGILRIIEKDDTIKDTFMRQATSMQYCVLKSKNTTEIVIIANTHLYYHPEANNVRLLQTAICLEYIKQLYNQESRNRNYKISVIFCGDFNSWPKSEVFNFLTKGVIQYTSEDPGSTGPTTIFHPFQLSSACGTPPFTNYTRDFKECLDYIFFDNLTLLGHVPLPDEDVLSENVALPSSVFPSDHLALIADFQFN